MQPRAGRAGAFRWWKIKRAKEHETSVIILLKFSALRQLRGGLGGAYLAETGVRGNCLLEKKESRPRMEFRLIAVTLASRGWTHVHDVAGFKRWGSENKSVASDQPSWKDPLFPLCVRKNPPAVYNCPLAICARLSFEVYRATLFLHGSSVTVNLCKRCINNGKSGKARRESRHFSCGLLNGQVSDVRSHLL